MPKREFDMDRLETLENIVGALREKELTSPLTDREQLERQITEAEICCMCPTDIEMGE